MGLKRESIFFSVMLLLFFHMATARLIETSLQYADPDEEINMGGKNMVGLGSRLLISSARPRGGNYINNPQAAEKAAVQASVYQP